MALRKWFFGILKDGHHRGSASMPSKKEYDLVSDDGYDSRIPLHNEDAFQHGIYFTAKYIGTLDVPRPSSRVEIVAAMRRIRYEFKAKGIKKKIVNIAISVEGVKVSLRKKKKKVSPWVDEKKLLIVQHPIYSMFDVLDFFGGAVSILEHVEHYINKSMQIFYVSHDSQDLKIWSYIARDGPSNVFKCNVFKSYKKEEAMRIVRTIGQAFEVCHKLSLVNSNPRPPEPVEESDDDQSGDGDKPSGKGKETEEKPCAGCDSRSTTKGRASPPKELALREAQKLLYQMASTTQALSPTTISSPMNSPTLLDDDLSDQDLPVSTKHQLKFLQQQMEHQQQQTQVAIAQVHLLKDQLAAETAARIESQARAHQLLLQNKDLLDHMSQLLTKLQDMEVRSGGASAGETAHLTTVLQKCPLPDCTTPQCGPVYIPESELQAFYGAGTYMIENSKTLIDTDSPDSGHREMSSDSLSAALQNCHRWTQAQYSYGFTSPVKYQTTELTALVSSNPFTVSNSSLDGGLAQNFANFEDSLKIKGPLSREERDDVDNDSRLAEALMIKPPPQFRTSDRMRDSQISQDSDSSSSCSDSYSLKDGLVSFPDSDYYSHTGSSTRTNKNGDNETLANNQTPLNTTYKSHMEIHYNNLHGETASALQRYFEDDSRSGDSLLHREDRDSEEEYLPQPPSPPPPPMRLEADSSDDEEGFISYND